MICTGYMLYHIRQFSACKHIVSDPNFSIPVRMPIWLPLLTDIVSLLAILGG